MNKNFKKGEIIIAENTIGDSAYIIKNGKVSVFITRDNQEVSLGILSEGQIFGEMSLIEDCPRSASIKAIEDTEVREISRRNFNELLKVDATILIPIMKALFERLRNANKNMLQFNMGINKQNNYCENNKILLKGLTDISSATLDGKTIEITKFPFKIGRKSQDIKDDILVDNDLYLNDKEPFNVSRNHIAICSIKDYYTIIDRSSSLGTIVNNIEIGRNKKAMEVQLIDGSNTVKLGLPSSDFIFEVNIIAPHANEKK